MNDLINGSVYYNVRCELFYDRITYRKRVRPLPEQDVPTSLFVECDRSIREKHLNGTIFTAETLTVCQKDSGAFYLRAKDQKITPL
jgi:hypothetical protein